MFITLEDPRAKIKGSRDPLGVQPVWASFGRHLVTNLTTVTASVRDFTVLLLGRHFGQSLAENGQADEDDAISIFLRVEQIAAYARHVIHGVDHVRGISRVRRFLDEQGNQVRISSSPKHMILSDQQMYGIWGLYSVAGRASGLLADGPLGLTDNARDFVETEYVARLDTAALRQFQKLALSDGKLGVRKNNRLLKAAASILQPQLTDAERHFYARTLRDVTNTGGEIVPGRQARLANLMIHNLQAGEIVGRAAVRVLSKTVEDEDPGLAKRLRMVDRLEALIAPADVVFELLLARNNQRPTDIAREIDNVWGRNIPHLHQPLDPLLEDIEAAAGSELTSVIAQTNDALRDGHYRDVVHLLLDWNRLVMQRRGAAPWVKLDDGGRVDVRYRGDEQKLPTAHELPEYWRNTYFLDSLAAITFQIESAQV